MRSKSILQGVNVPIAPTSTSETKLTNNITISNVAYPNVEVNPYKDIEEAPGQGTEALPAKAREVPDSSYVSYSEKPNELDAYLLKLSQAILLSENKKLLSNVISKDSIILTQEDLEKVIELKTGKKCVISYEDPEVTCCNMNTIFMKITSIRITEKDGPNGPEQSCDQADFKIKYNKDYLELITNYHINLKYVLVN